MSDHDTLTFTVRGDDYQDLRDKAEAAILRFVRSSLNGETDLSIEYQMLVTEDVLVLEDRELRAWVGEVSASLISNRAVRYPPRS